MKKKTFAALGCGGLALTIGLLIAATSNAGVNVNINIPLPGLVIPAPPGLIVIPGTYVYYPPEVDVDIFFYHGYWYRPYEGRWYRSADYNGPWGFIPARRVPPSVMRVPPAYRTAPPVHERMPYGTVRRNWRTWENERHWDRHDRGRGYGDDEGRGEGHGRGRGDMRGRRGDD